MTGFIRTITFSTALAITPCVLILSMSAQVQSINGTIRGRVTDASGAPVPSATVTIKNIETGYTRDLVSDQDGDYLAPNLPIGTYSVTAASASFAPLTQTGIHLDAGTDATVNETLKAGSVATEIEVTSDAPIIESTRVDLGRTISTAEVQNLPLTSRNPYNFILFQPGVSGHPNPENGIPRTVNTNGLVDRVSYQLDGMVDTETDRYGLRLFAISDSYVQEVQTISNSFPAEFGNIAGIIYNVITPSGTNNLHGQVQYIWRPKTASSCPMLQNCTPGAPGYKIKPDLHVDDYVARAGGPIIKDKLFFFGAYEKLKRANPQAITVTSANQALLVANGVAASDFNTAPQVQRAQWVDARGDWTINKSNQAFVRYNYFRNNYPFNSNVGGLFAQSASADFRDRAHIIGAQLITTFTSNLLNEFRGSWPYRNQQHFASNITGPGPMVIINGVVSGFGGTNSAGDKFQEKIPSFSDNLTLIRGKHAFKFGVGFQKNLDTQLADVYTQFTFANVQQWIDAKSGKSPHVYSSLKTSIGRPGAAYHSVFFDVFAQDTWRLSPKLIATYGVRYDQYRAPDGQPNALFSYTRSFRTPKGNFAPRVGFAYSPVPTTVIRLNAGMFYEATPTNSWYNPLYQNGAAGTGSYITTVAGASTESAATKCQTPFPQSPTSLDPSCIPIQDIFALTPKFKNEYTWNANLQVQQQLTTNDALTLGYIMTNGRNFQFLRNLNLVSDPNRPIAPLADGRPVFSSTISPTTRLDSRFGNITLIDIGANTSFNALTATYEHRMSAGLTASASYTWSHSLSDTPEANSYEFSNAIEDTTNRKRDRGNSSVNRPNSLTISTVYQPSTHFESKWVRGLVNNNNLAVLANLSSGDPQNITTSSVINGDPIAVQRPLFIRRNSVTTPSIYQVDARYTRTFGNYFDRIKPQVFVEANNVFNRSNFTTINTAATVVTAANSPLGPIGTITPTGQPTLKPTGTVLESRILQFGARIEF